MSGPSAEHGVSPTGRSLARDPHKEETCCGKWSRKQQVFPKPTNILVVAAMGLVRADLQLVATIYLVRGRGCCPRGLLSILILGALFERSYQAGASPQPTAVLSVFLIDLASTTRTVYTSSIAQVTDRQTHSPRGGIH